MRALLVLLLLLVPATAVAQEPTTGRVTVRVFYDVAGDGYRFPGDPILPAAMTLTAADGSTRTAISDGSFGAAFADVPPGPATVSLDPRYVPVAPSARTSPADVTAGGVAIVDISARGARISGRVVPARRGAVVSVDGPGRVLAETGRDGRFATEPLLPAGAYTVTARRPLAASASAPVPAGAGEDVIAPALRLRPHAAAPVHVVPAPTTIIGQTAPDRPMTLLDQDLRPIPGAPKLPSDTLYADLSPGGRRIAAAGATTLNLYAVRGGDLIRSVPVTADAIRTVSWIAPDRVLLVSGFGTTGTATRIDVLDAGTGALTETTLPDPYASTSRIGAFQVVATADGPLTVLDADGIVVSRTDLDGGFATLSGGQALFHGPGLATVDPATGAVTTAPVTVDGTWVPQSADVLTGNAGTEFLDRRFAVTRIVPNIGFLRGDGRGGVVDGGGRIDAHGRRVWLATGQTEYPMVFGRRVYRPGCRSRRTTVVIYARDSGRRLAVRRHVQAMMAPTAGASDAARYLFSPGEGADSYPC